MKKLSGTELERLLRKALVVADEHPENRVFFGVLEQTDDNGNFCVKVPNSFMGKLFTRRYQSCLRGVLGTEFGDSITLDVVVDPSLIQTASGSETPTSNAEDHAVTALPAQSRKPERKGFLKGAVNKQFTLDSFVVGECNRQAYQAVLELVRSPQPRYYPVYLHGTSGLGKTHLLQGLCNALHRSRPEARIHYLTCEEFTNKLIQSIKRHTQEQFRDELRDLDLLVVDDVHFLSTRKVSQEEFVHTFNALQNASRALVVSSDAHPSDQAEIQEHLRARFTGGLVLNLSLPDISTRRDILLSKLGKSAPGLAITPDWMRIVDIIARNDYSSVREYEGALNKLVFTFQTEHGKSKVDFESVNALLANGHRKWTIDECYKKIEARFGITAEVIKSKNRARNISRARGLFILLVREKLDLPLKEIGRILGGRAHTTILEMEAKVRASIENDPEWRSDWDAILGM